MPSFVDISGEKFGRWTAIKRVGTKAGGALWLCKCDCGKIGEVRSNALRSGKSKSCGCYNLDVRREVCVKRNTKHGHAKRGNKSRAYKIWDNLKLRHHKKSYRDVGICPRWAHFQNFLEDMGEPPSPKHTLDRINNTEGYSPGNCRWATMKEQQNNRTNNRIIIAFGESRTLQQWSEEFGIDGRTISARIQRGWPVEKALTEEPVVGKNQYS
jgi:hypothetical protein